MFLSCNNSEKNYEKILNSLEKNYTATKSIAKKDVLFCWNVNQLQFSKDSIEYRKGINDFYNQRVSFIEYLLEKKNQNNMFNNWIVAKNPCSSTITELDFISNLKGSLILIDNLIIGNKNDIIINDYIDEINYVKLKSIIIKNKKKSFQDIKIDYIRYVNDIKKKV